jgi:hypothetical protein
MSARKRDERKSGGGPTVPKWLPTVLFGGLTVFLFRSFIFSDQMLFGNDTMGLGYIARALYVDMIGALGRFPRWQPHILGGTPFLEALSAGESFYPPSLLLLLIMEPYRALGWKLILHVLAAGFFMFGWTRAIGTSRAAALVAGTGYMLAPMLVSFVHPGGDGKLFVTALAPLLFWVVERHFVRPRLATFTSVALVIGLVIYTTHFQMAYFLFGGVGMFAIFRATQLARQGKASALPVRPRAGITFGLFLAASLMGAGIAAFQLVPAVEYATQSSRRTATTRAEVGETSIAWSSSWSIHPEEALSLIVPGFAGNQARNWKGAPYWGRNGAKDNHESAGLILMLLAAVSFVGGARRGLRFYFLGLSALAFFFALGANTPVWGIIYSIVPGISLFRAPSQAMFLFAFSMATLAALGVDRLLRQPVEGDEEERSLSIVMVAGLGVVTAIAIMISSGFIASIWPLMVFKDMGDGRIQALADFMPEMSRSAWASVLLTAGFTGLALVFRKGRLAPIALLAGLVGLVAVDALRLDQAFIVTLDHDEFYAPNANIQAVLDREAESTEPYRLFSMIRNSQDVSPSLHGIELAAGHHPNDLARYRQLIGMVGSGDAVNLINSGTVRRLLNVKYILYPDYARRQPYEGPGIIQRLQGSDGQPFETMIEIGALPRARLVGSAVVKSDEEAVPYMLSAAFDPEREVVLAEAPPASLGGGPGQGDVTWLERGPDRMRLSVTSDQAAMLVISDNWFAGWQATVGGVDTPVLRAYHTLRAIPVPAGQSEIEVWYASATVRMSLWVSVLLSLALAGANGFVWWRDRPRGSTQP